MNEIDASTNETTSAAGSDAGALVEAEVAFVTPALWGRRRSRQAGKVRPMVLLWALGVPLPIIAIIFLVRGCH